MNSKRAACPSSSLKKHFSGTFSPIKRHMKEKFNLKKSRKIKKLRKMHTIFQKAYKIILTQKHRNISN